MDSAQMPFEVRESFEGREAVKELAAIQQSLTLGAIFFLRFTLAVIDILIFHGLLQPNFSSCMVVSLRLLNPARIFLQFSSMNIFYMISVSFLFLEFKLTRNAFNSLTQMYNFHMPVEMIFVSKSHTAVRAFEFFDISVRNHVPFEVGFPFEGFVTIFLFACVIPFGSMPFSHMAVEMGELLEEFIADLAGLRAILQFLRNLPEGQLLNLLLVRHNNYNSTQPTNLWAFFA